MLIIFKFEFNLHAVDTACFVDLFYCQLCCILNSQSIYGCSSGDRSDSANLQCITC